MNKNNIKNIFFNTVGNMAYLGAIWLISILVVKLSNFTNAGMLSVAMSTSNIYISLASYTARLYYAADIEEKYSDSQYFTFRFLTTTVSLILCIGISLFIGYSIQQFLVIVLFYIYKVEEMLSDILIGTMQRKDCLYKGGITITVKAIFSLLAFIIILLFTRNLIFALIAIDIVGGLVLILGDYRIACDLSGEVIIIDLKKYKPILNLLVICFPLFITGLCYNIIPSLPRLVFERMYTAEEMGYYSSISTITVLISTAVNCIIVPLIPTLSTYYKQKDKKKFSNLSWGTGGIIVCLGIICILLEHLFGNWILKILFGSEILPYEYIFKWVIIATILTSEIILFNAVFTSVNLQDRLMKASLVGLVICIITVLPLCRYLYMLGVTLCLIIAQTVEIIVLLAYTLNISKKFI